MYILCTKTNESTFFSFSLYNLGPQIFNDFNSFKNLVHLSFSTSIASNTNTSGINAPVDSTVTENGEKRI